jgi:hypothetical protein
MRKIASLVAAAVLLSIASAGLSLAQQAPPPAGAGAGAPGRGGAPPPPFRIMRPEKRIIKGRPFGVGFDRSHQRLRKGAPSC